MADDKKQKNEQLDKVKKPSKTQDDHKEEILWNTREELLSAQLLQFQKEISSDKKIYTWKEIVSSNILRKKFASYLKDKNKASLADALEKVFIYDQKNWSFDSEDFLWSLRCADFETLEHWCQDYINQSLNKTGRTLMYTKYVETLDTQISNATNNSNDGFRAFLSKQWLPIDFTQFQNSGINGEKKWVAREDRYYIELHAAYKLYLQTHVSEKEKEKVQEYVRNNVNFRFSDLERHAKSKGVGSDITTAAYKTTWLQYLSPTKTKTHKTAQSVQGTFSKMIGEITDAQQWSESSDADTMNLEESVMTLGFSVLDDVVHEQHTSTLRQKLVSSLNHRWFIGDLLVGQDYARFEESHPQAQVFKKTLPASSWYESTVKNDLRVVSDKEYRKLQDEITEAYLDRIKIQDPELREMIQQVDTLTDEWVTLDTWQSNKHPENIRQQIEDISSKLIRHNLSKKLDALDTEWILDIFPSRVGESPLTPEQIKVWYKQFLLDYHDPKQLVVDIPGRRKPSGDAYQIVFHRKELKFPVWESGEKLSIFADLVWWDRDGDIDLDYEIDPERSDQWAYMMLQHAAGTGPVLNAKIDTDEDDNIIDISEQIIEWKKYTVTSRETWSTTSWYPVKFTSYPEPDRILQTYISFVDKERAHNFYTLESYPDVSDLKTDDPKIPLSINHKRPKTSPRTVHPMFEQYTFARDEDESELIRRSLHHDTESMPAVLNAIYVHNNSVSHADQLDALALQTKKIEQAERKKDLANKNSAYMRKFDLDALPRWFDINKRQTRHVGDFNSRQDPIFVRIMQRRLDDHPEYDNTSPEYLAAVEDHRENTQAWVQWGEIYFRTSKLEEKLERSIQSIVDSDDIVDLDLEFAMQDGVQVIRNTWSQDEWKTIEQYFDKTYLKQYDRYAYSSDSVIEMTLENIHRWYAEWLQKMRRHEEVHRIFEFFDIDELKIWNLTLTEEDLCRIAENDSGLDPDEMLTDHGLMKIKLENGAIVELNLWEINTRLSTLLTTKIQSDVYDVPWLLSLTQRNPDWRFVLQFFANDKGRVVDQSNVAEIWNLLSPYYTDEDFATLYASTTSTTWTWSPIIPPTPTPPVTPGTPPVTPSWTATTSAASTIQGAVSEVSGIKESIKRLASNMQLWSAADQKDDLIKLTEELQKVSWPYDKVIAQASSALMTDEHLTETQKSDLRTLLKKSLKEYPEYMWERADHITTLIGDEVSSSKKDELLRSKKQALKDQYAWLNRLKEYAESTADRPALIDLSPSEKLTLQQQIADLETKIQDASSVEKADDDFDQVFGNLQGDDVKLENWNLLYFRTWSSELPGAGTSRFKGEISNVTPTHYTLTITDSTEWWLQARKVTTRPRTVKDLRKLKSWFMGEIYRMSPETNSLEKAATRLDGSAYGAWFKSFGMTNRSAWGKDYIKNSEEKHGYEKDYKKWGKRNLNNIKYLWAQKNDEDYYFYEIDHGSDGVNIKLIPNEDYNLIYEQKMDYPTFALRAADKRLSPFSQSEYDSVTQANDPPQDLNTRTSFADHFMSIGWIIAAFKKFPEAFTSYMEERERYQSAKLYAKMASPLKEIWLRNIGDVWYDAMTELDQQVWSVIQKRKSRLSSDDDRNGVHKKANALRIEREIFQNIQTGEKYRQKSAGYLLYALEMGNMYYRELSHYKHSGIWVKAILGNGHHTAFMQARAKKEADLKNRWREDEEARGDLINFEIQYIADNSSAWHQKYLYGSQFGKTVESFTENSDQDYTNQKQGIEKKSSFYEIYKTTYWKIDKQEPGGIVAGIEIMLDRMEYPHHYHMVYGIIVQLFASGVWAHVLDNYMAGKLKQMWRTYGIPLLLLAKDMHSTRRVINIMDAIAIQKAWWIRSDANLLSDALKLPVNPDHVNMENFTNSNATHKEENYKWSKHYKRGHNTLDRRRSNGQDMINALQFKSTYLFEALDDSKSMLGSTEDEQIRADINYYYDKVHDGEQKWNAAIDESAFKWWDSPAYENGILNLSPWWFDKLLLSGYSTTDNSFRDDNAYQMRELLTATINNFDSVAMSSEGKSKEYLLHMVTKKFINYFRGKRMGMEELWEFQSALKRWDSARANAMIDAMIKNSKREKSRPITRWMKAFKDFFTHHEDAISYYSKKKKGIMSDAFVDIKG